MRPVTITEQESPLLTFREAYEEGYRQGLTDAELALYEGEDELLALLQRNPREKAIRKVEPDVKLHDGDMGRSIAVVLIVLVLFGWGLYVVMHVAAAQ